MKTIAVICSDGMGDAIILQIISHHLWQAGYLVTTFSDHLADFGIWLSSYQFQKQPEIEDIPEIASRFDAIVLQHDNSLKSRTFQSHHNSVFTFYGSHVPSKHRPLSSFDYVADPTQSMVDNVEKAMHQWFSFQGRDNGLTPPPGLIHRKYRKRVAIHPHSSDPKRNWPLSSFQAIASFLQQEGYEPFFITHDHQPAFPSLENLASVLYESGFFLGNDSGPGHLASSLQIPSLIIGKDFHHLQLWRPGWLPPIVITPPRLATHFKWTRTKWQLFITINKIKTTISKLIRNNR